MGAKQSDLAPIEPQIEEYEELTYLSKAEIVYLTPETPVERVLLERIAFDRVSEGFPQLKFNPFRDRIKAVFSSAGDDCFSFEDLLDIHSVMCTSCPSDVKAAWAFRIFDFNDDNSIDSHDLKCALDRLTGGFSTQPDKQLTKEHKEEMARKVMGEMDIESSGRIGQLAFQHGVLKMSEFSRCFSLTV